MAKIAICDGDIKMAGGQASPFQCYGLDGVTVKSFQFVDYVEPTDSTAIYSELLALNEFDPVKISLMVVFAFAIFTMSFSAAVVIKKLRQA